ncbi:Protein-ribulosamine 3-kinase, chloroplastic [Linum perenne]
MAAAQLGIASTSCCYLPMSRPPFCFTRRRSFAVAAMSDDPISDWITTEGKATQITRISPVGGGCINRANRYETDAGSFFVKTNRSIGPSMFEGEALGLNAMYETGTIRVPKPFKVGALPTGGSYIIMEFIKFGAARLNQSELGRKLAEMHKAGKSGKGFGFDVDNTIGSTPQINTWTSDWIEFYAKHRLGYQLKLALDQYGDSTIYQKGALIVLAYLNYLSVYITKLFSTGQKLVKNMAPLFDNIVIEPCLLHGDLWSGNISSDNNGDPVILDPACYYGHSEAEFGMSWCAGFGGAFYNGYFEVMPKQAGFEKRKDLYMLYHYLNHYNLFGSGYRSSSMAIIDDYLRLLNV